MARILTGIQSTGTPHLGNILGAIVPAIEMANDLNNDSFLLFTLNISGIRGICGSNPRQRKDFLSLILVTSLFPKCSVIY